jgi:hypothetical protein
MQQSRLHLKDKHFQWLFLFSYAIRYNQQDLTNAKTNLSELKENMPQMTISEVKQKWSISFGTIIKWSKKKFIQFMNIDKASGNDISRLIDLCGSENQCFRVNW